MKFLLFTFVFWFSALVGWSQNLAPNAGFENYNSLPNNYCQWDHCVTWNNVNGNTGCGTSGTPDYYHTNSTGSVSLPNIGTGIDANSGNAIMGFLTWSGTLYPEYREYIAAPLTQPMIAGQVYTVSFYLANGDTPYYGYGSNNIGMHFSNGALSQISNEVINVIPQVEITNVFFSNNWQLFTFTFTPTSNFTHITIGNFKDDANTMAQMYYPNQGRAYYHIDDISIVTSGPNNTLTVSSDATICEGDSITLEANGDANNVYNWVDNAGPGNILWTDSIWTIAPTSTTTYNVYGSGDTVSVTVTVDPVPMVDLGNDTSFCSGGMLILDASYTGASYSWQDNSSGPSYSVMQAGTYWVDVSIGNCAASDTINVTLVDIPVVDLGVDTVICQGELYVLDASLTGAEYLWQDNSTLSTYTVTNPGMYWVTLNAGGCLASDTIQVDVESCVVILEMPNVFTPDGDGVNEQFIPVNIQGVETLNVIILNRWGQQVFESDNLLIEWDAFDVMDGTYFWMVRYTSSQDEEFVKTGFVQIIRK